MGVMKIKLNAFLMGLVTIILIGFIVSAIYFQDTMEIVNSKYNQKTEQLDLTKEELQFQVNQLANLNNSLQNLSSDLESYTTEFDTVYGICEEDRDKLSIEVASLNKELIVQKQKVQEKLVELKNIKTQLTSIKSDVEESNSDLDDILDKVDSIESVAENIKDDIDDNNNANLTLNQCKNLLDDIDSQASSIKSKASSSQGIIGKTINFIASINSELSKIISALKNY